MRILTGESFSHSAIALKEEDTLFVVETREKTGGTVKILFDDWIKDYSHAYLGIPVAQIADNRVEIQKRIYEYLEKPKEEKKYGYWTLPLVWLNQLMPKKKFKNTLNVCSTLVQYFWNATKWKIGKLADPGDLALSVLVLYKIE